MLSWSATGFAGLPRSYPQTPDPQVTRRPTLKISRPNTEAAPDRIHIVIADYRTVMREGLTALLAAHSDFAIVGEAENGRDVLRIAAERRPDILLLDCSLMDVSVLDVIRELHNGDFRPPRTILFTTAADELDIVSFLRLGGRGVLSKNAPTAMIVKSIRKVHRGEVWLGRETMADVISALTLTAAAPPGPARVLRLTAREREVLQLVFEGETNKGIANRLEVAEDTIKHHLTNIFDKTGASNRLELVRFALHHSLVTQD
jgi:two-component system, NarL family, nitrate/nitrite response regulator NarL